MSAAERNIETFPNNLKKEISAIIDTEFTSYDQLLIIYYSKYKNDAQFSFEHLCVIIRNIADIPITRLTTRYRSTYEWNIKSINERIIHYLIEYLLR